MTNTIPEIDVPNTMTGVLIAFYNTHSGKAPIKKFSTRGAGEKQVRALIRERNWPESVPLSEGAQSVATEPQESAVMAKEKKTNGATAPRKVKAPKQKKPPANMSEAVSRTWKNPETAKLRATHHHVKASGTTYRSVKHAFETLGLPLGRHIPFRRLVKVNGEAVFKFKDGDNERAITFRLVPREDKPAATPKTKKAAKKKAAKKAAKPKVPGKKRVRKPKAVPDQSPAAPELPLDQALATE